MKKLLLTLSFMISATAGHSLPCGNPAEPSLSFNETCCYFRDDFFLDVVDLRIGFYGDYVFERYLETTSGRHVDFSEMYTNAGYIALNICKVVDLFTTLGATEFALDTSLGPFNSANTDPKFQLFTSPSFSWSVGARATLFEHRCFVWGVEGQYFACRTKPHVLYVRTNVNSLPDETSRRLYSEWQVGTGFAYHYSNYFVPYIAAKYNRARWEFENETFDVTGTTATIPNLRGSRNWGYGVGLSLFPFNAERIVVTAEGRFGNERAFYINGQLRF